MSDRPLFGDSEPDDGEPPAAESSDPAGETFADLWASSAAEDDESEAGEPVAGEPVASEPARSEAAADEPATQPFRAPPEPGEGVRVIPPEEAAEAAEREDVARRRGLDEPRYGDRPEPPRSDVTPSLRLPLPGQASPEDVERPKAAAPIPRDSDGEPIISLDPPSDEVMLPHWTQPGTGEVPKVIVGDDAEEDTTSAERWMASGAGPRWRDEHVAAATDDFDPVSGLADEESRVGALDTDAESTEGYLRFDDLDIPSAGEHRLRRSSPPPGAPPPPTGAGSPGSSSSNPPTPRSRSEAPTSTTPSSAPGRDTPRGPQASWPPEGGPPAGQPPRGGSGQSGGTGGRNMGQAIGVGVGLGLLTLVLAWAGAAWLMILVEVAIVLVAVEYFSALRRAGFQPATLPGLVAVAALPLAAYARGDAAIPLILFLLAICGTLWYLLGAGKGRIARDLGATFLAVIHVGVLGSFAALILRTGPVGGAEVDQGASLLVAALVVAVFYDVGGLFSGSRLGHTPLSAASPNKTWEGLGGGLAMALLALLIAVYFPIFGLTELSVGQVLLFGVACSLAAIVGDLGQSLIKRDLGLKDMGTLLPGHGGVFDRCDGMLFVLPTAYYLVRVFFA